LLIGSSAVVRCSIIAAPWICSCKDSALSWKSRSVQFCSVWCSIAFLLTPKGRFWIPPPARVVLLLLLGTRETLRGFIAHNPARFCRGVSLKRCKCAPHRSPWKRATWKDGYLNTMLILSIIATDESTEGLCSRWWPVSWLSFGRSSESGSRRESRGLQGSQKDYRVPTLLYYCACFPLLKLQDILSYKAPSTGSHSLLS
jgi:hypothetical protein